MSVTSSELPKPSHVASHHVTPAGLLFLGITSLSWGLNFPIMKVILAEWPPLAARGISGVVGAVGLAVVALVLGQDLRVPRHLWPRLIGISILTVSGWAALMGLALVWLPASEAAVIAISISVWVALMAWPILGERISLTRGIALAVALVSIAVLIGGKGIDVSFDKWPGIVFAFAATVIVASGTVSLKRFPLPMPPVALAAWQIGLGCVPVALAGLVLETPSIAALSGTGWAAMFYLTAVQFCVAYVSWFAALSRLPASTASIGTLMVPIIGVVSSAFFLHEPLGMRDVIALVFAIGAVAVAMRS